MSTEEVQWLTHMGPVSQVLCKPFAAKTMRDAGPSPNPIQPFRPLPRSKQLHPLPLPPLLPHPSSSLLHPHFPNRAHPIPTSPIQCSPRTITKKEDHLSARPIPSKAPDPWPDLYLPVSVTRPRDRTQSSEGASLWSRQVLHNGDRDVYKRGQRRERGSDTREGGFEEFEI